MLLVDPDERRSGIGRTQPAKPARVADRGKLAFYPMLAKSAYGNGNMSRNRCCHAAAVDGTADRTSINSIFTASARSFAIWQVPAA